MTNRSLLTESEYAAEAARHMDWLNWVFGLTTFLYAVTALQFPSPDRICALGYVLWIPMYVHAFRSFPPSLVALRAVVRETGDHDATALLKRLERKFHGWGALARAWPLWAAWALYFAVSLSFIDKPPFNWILWFKGY